MFWFQQGLSILPVGLVVVSSSTFIISYIIAVVRQDVDVLLPFISDTGNAPPESCVFGILTFLTSCIGICTIYAMYKYMEQMAENSGVVCAGWNRAALGLGLLTCLGMSVVSNFQESAVITVHLLGALLFFLCGTLYISAQTYLSYHIYPYGSSLFVCRARLAISLTSFALFLPKTSVICKFLDKDPQLTKASAGCEWILAFTFVSFFFTYIDDFKLFKLDVKALCGPGNML